MGKSYKYAHNRTSHIKLCLRINVIKLNDYWWSPSSCYAFSYCYSNIITRWYSSGIRRPQKSSSDHQWENKWRSEPQPRKSRSHCVTWFTRKQLTSPSVSLFTSQYAEHLQTSCTRGPLWVSNWHLGLGLSLGFPSSTPHTPAEREQVLSGILTCSFFFKDKRSRAMWETLPIFTQTRPHVWQLFIWTSFI